MFAVIKTGGKQYRVAANDVLKIEKVAGEVGDIVEIGHVLAHGEGDDVTFGAPFVDGALVTAEVVAQGRASTVIAFKKRRRQNSRRRHGHRQYETTVRIDEILLGGAKPSKKAAAEAGQGSRGRGAPAPAKKAKAPAAEAAPVAALADLEPKAKPAKAKAAKAEVVDDISLISGIGPVLKEKMTEAGYAHADVDLEAQEGRHRQARRRARPRRPHRARGMGRAGQGIAGGQAAAGAGRQRCCGRQGIRVSRATEGDQPWHTRKLAVRRATVVIPNPSALA